MATKYDGIVNKVLELAVKYDATYIETVIPFYKFEQHLEDMNYRGKTPIIDEAFRMTERYMHRYYTKKD